MKYAVTVIEKLSRSVEIEAGSENDAKAIAHDMWSNGKILLGDRDFEGVEYKAVRMFNPRLISRGTACDYLRVNDYSPEHDFIDECIEEATQVSFEEAKITPEDWEEIKNDHMICDLMRVACLYAMGWLYEHKDEKDRYDLIMTLRCLLFSIRERKLWKVSE